MATVQGWIDAKKSSNFALEIFLRIALLYRLSSAPLPGGGDKDFA
jgi:hypothetical protein